MGREKQRKWMEKSLRSGKTADEMIESEVETENSRGEIKDEL